MRYRQSNEIAVTLTFEHNKKLPERFAGAETGQLNQNPSRERTQRYMNILDYACECNLYTYEQNTIFVSDIVKQTI